jgi:hypothetical protein
MQNAGGGKLDGGERLVEAGNYSRPRGDIRRVRRDDDVLPLRERGRERLPGAPPHDHGVAARERAEVPEVVGQAPREAAARADDAVPRDGGDDREGRITGRDARRGSTRGCARYRSTRGRASRPRAVS